MYDLWCPFCQSKQGNELHQNQTLSKAAVLSSNLPMSTSSTQSKGVNRRINSLQGGGNGSREGSRLRKRMISHHEGYIYALRVAYLAYLLQPKARRMQHVPAPSTTVQRSSTSTSINDLMKDFSLLRDSKSTKFPHGFMSELEKRLTGVLMGKERKPEYNDPTVKRTFAVFLNAFTEQSFKKRMEKDRRVEDLVLIFFSNATKELQKGKAPGDDAWKLMVDRHLALFVRLISLVLKDHDWMRDRPDLSSRLATLESKLLAHDQDLAAATSRNGGAGGSTVEVIIPLTYDVKDMALVQHVARVFGLTNTQVQSDINKYKPIWTEQAALQDLKTYQTYLSFNSRKTLRNDDFDLDESYQIWKKAEVQDLSQMMLAIIQSNPELARSTSGGNNPRYSRSLSSIDTSDLTYPDASRKNDDSQGSSYVIDQPVDMSSLTSGNDTTETVGDDDDVYTFIPPEPRAYYRFVLAQALTHDLKEIEGQAREDGEEALPVTLLSKHSIELLGEVCMRWRIPQVSRTVLFLDVIKEKFVDQEISLDMLDAAFNLVKEPSADGLKGSSLTPPLPADRQRWPLADNGLYQHVLSALHDALLRDLYDLMQHCYEQKAPGIGPTLIVLESHILDDPSFTKTADDLKVFSNQLYEGLRKKAHEIYRDFLEKEVPQDQQSWEFFHVIELGKAVVTLAQRIQKRYRKTPEIMG